MSEYENQTPAEIDAALAKHYEEVGSLQHRANRAAESASRAALAAAHAVDVEYARRLRLSARESRAAAAELYGQADAIVEAEIAPRENEWTRRCGWSRYYLVLNSNGHVHRSQHCVTCFRNTEFGWLTERSGDSVAEIVATYGEVACTVCFPSAPTLRGYGDGTSALAQCDAAAKAARAAAKEAKRAARVVVPPHARCRYEVSYKTERGAELAIGDEIYTALRYGDGGSHRAADRKADALVIAVALAEKRNVSVDEVLTPIVKRVEKKIAAEDRRYGR